MTTSTLKTRKPTVQGRVLAIDPALIDRSSGQPRQEFDDAQQRGLEESVRAHGVLTPLEVVEAEKGRYRLIYGERRLRAALLTGQTSVPCIVSTQTHDWRATRTKQLVENTHRADLTPLEFWQTVQILWLDAQVAALTAEQGVDTISLDDDLPPTAQIAALTERLFALSGHTALDAYLGSGNVRVPFGTVLERLGFGTMSAAQRKAGLRVLDVAPAVQDMLAGVDVSARALRDLAKRDPDAQAQLVAGAQQNAADGHGNVGAALRAALDAPLETVDEDTDDGDSDEGDDAKSDAKLLRPEKQHNPDDAIPGFLKETGTASKLITDQAAPARGSIPPIAGGWDRDTFLVLISGLEALLDTLDRAGATPLNEGQTREARVLWNELVERLPRFGLEVS